MYFEIMNNFSPWVIANEVFFFYVGRNPYCDNTNVYKSSFIDRH